MVLVGEMSGEEWKLSLVATSQNKLGSQQFNNQTTYKTYDYNSQLTDNAGLEVGHLQTHDAETQKTLQRLSSCHQGLFRLRFIFGKSPKNVLKEWRIQSFWFFTIASIEGCLATKTANITLMRPPMIMSPLRIEFSFSPKVLIASKSYHFDGR